MFWDIGPTSPGIQIDLDKNHESQHSLLDFSQIPDVGIKYKVFPHNEKWEIGSKLY